MKQIRIDSERLCELKKTYHWTNFTGDKMEYQDDKGRTRCASYVHTGEIYEYIWNGEEN